MFLMFKPYISDLVIGRLKTCPTSLLNRVWRQLNQEARRKWQKSGHSLNTAADDTV